MCCSCAYAAALADLALAQVQMTAVDRLNLPDSCLQTPCQPALAAPVQSHTQTFCWHQCECLLDRQWDLTGHKLHCEVLVQAGYSGYNGLYGTAPGIRAQHSTA